MDEETAEPPPEEIPSATETPSDDAPLAEAQQPVAARPPRSMVTFIAGAVIVVVIAVGVIGYAFAGVTFAASRLASIRTAYNAVVSHQNAITDEFNAFDSKVTAADLTTGAATLKQNRAAYDTLVSQSQAAQPTIAADDASLATAQAHLNDNSWLTLFSRSSLNNASLKMGHERKALATAKTLAADLILLGTFYQAFYDSLIDLDTLSTKAQATDFTGAAAATTTLKTDITKAIELTNAPGLPPEMKLFLTDFQTLAADFGKLLDAAIAGDANAANADLKAVEADITKIGLYDTDKMSTDTKAFYQPLLDTFNSEVAKANRIQI